MKNKIIFLLFLFFLSSCSNDDKNNARNIEVQSNDFNDSVKKIEELRIKNQRVREKLENTDDLEADYFYSLNNGLPIPFPKELKWNKLG